MDRDIQIPGFGFEEDVPPKLTQIDNVPPKLTPAGNTSVFGLISKVNKGILKEPGKSILKKPCERVKTSSEAENPSLQQAQAVADHLSVITRFNVLQQQKHSAFMAAKSKVEQIQLGLWKPSPGEESSAATGSPSTGRTVSEKPVNAKNLAHPGLGYIAEHAPPEGAISTISSVQRNVTPEKYNQQIQSQNVSLQYPQNASNYSQNVAKRKVIPVLQTGNVNYSDEAIVQKGFKKPLPVKQTTQTVGLVDYEDDDVDEPAKIKKTLSRESALKEIDMYRAKPYKAKSSVSEKVIPVTSRKKNLETRGKKEQFKNDFDRYFYGNASQKSEIRIRNDNSKDNDDMSKELSPKPNISQNDSYKGNASSQDSRYRSEKYDVYSPKSDHEKLKPASNSEYMGDYEAYLKGINTNLVLDSGTERLLSENRLDGHSEGIGKTYSPSGSFDYGQSSQISASKVDSCHHTSSGQAKLSDQNGHKSNEEKFQKYSETEKNISGEWNNITANVKDFKTGSLTREDVSAQSRYAGTKQGNRDSSWWGGYSSSIVERPNAYNSSRENDMYISGSSYRDNEYSDRYTSQHGTVERNIKDNSKGNDGKDQLYEDFLFGTNTEEHVQRRESEHDRNVVLSDQVESYYERGASRDGQDLGREDFDYGRSETTGNYVLDQGGFGQSRHSMDVRNDDIYWESPSERDRQSLNDDNIKKGRDSMDVQSQSSRSSRSEKRTRSPQSVSSRDGSVAAKSDHDKERERDKTSKHLEFRDDSRQDSRAVLREDRNTRESRAILREHRDVRDDRDTRRENKDISKEDSKHGERDNRREDRAFARVDRDSRREISRRERDNGRGDKASQREINRRERDDGNEDRDSRREITGRERDGGRENRANLREERDSRRGDRAILREERDSQRGDRAILREDRDSRGEISRRGKDHRREDRAILREDRDTQRDSHRENRDIGMDNRDYMREDDTIFWEDKVILAENRDVRDEEAFIQDNQYGFSHMDHRNVFRDDRDYEIEIGSLSREERDHFRDERDIDRNQRYSGIDEQFIGRDNMEVREDFRRDEIYLRNDEIDMRQGDRVDLEISRDDRYILDEQDIIKDGMDIRGIERNKTDRISQTDEVILRDDRDPDQDDKDKMGEDSDYWRPANNMDMQTVPVLPAFHCKDCNITCLDQEVYDYHLQSDTHVLTLQKKAAELFQMSETTVRKSRFDTDTTGNPIVAVMVPPPAQPTSMITGISATNTMKNSVAGMRIGQNVFRKEHSPSRREISRSPPRELKFRNRPSSGIQVIPPKPMGPLEPLAVGVNKLTIKWKSLTPMEEDLIEKYVVEYRNARETHWVRVGQTSHHDYEIDGLQENTDYLFRVLSMNGTEKSEVLESVLVTTRKRRDSPSRSSRISAERRERRSSRDRNRRERPLTSSFSVRGRKLNRNTDKKIDKSANKKLEKSNNKKIDNSSNKKSESSRNTKSENIRNTQSENRRNTNSRKSDSKSERVVKHPPKPKPKLTKSERQKYDKWVEKVKHNKEAEKMKVQLRNDLDDMILKLDNYGNVANTDQGVENKDKDIEMKKKKEQDEDKNKEKGVQKDEEKDKKGSEEIKLENETSKKVDEPEQDYTECLLYSYFEKDNPSPMLGLDYIREILNYKPTTPPRYLCKLCNAKGSGNIMVKHLYGFPHKLEFFRVYDPTIAESVSMMIAKKSQLERLDYEGKLIEDKFGRGSVKVLQMLNPIDTEGKIKFKDFVSVKAPPPSREKVSEPQPEAAIVESQFQQIYDDAIKNEVFHENDNAMIGLASIKEAFHPQNQKPAKYVCSLCNCVCGQNTIIFHIVGKKHRMAYFKQHRPELFESLSKMKDHKKLIPGYAAEIEEKDGRGVMKRLVCKTDRLWRFEKRDGYEENQNEDNAKTETETIEEEKMDTEPVVGNTEEKDNLPTHEGNQSTKFHFDLKKPEMQSTNVKQINVLEQSKPKTKEAFDWNKENEILQKKIQNQTVIKCTRKSKFITVYSEFFKKYPVIGLQWVTEFQKPDPKLEPWYMCFLCQHRLLWKNILDHVTSNVHRLNYMKKNYKEKYKSLYKLISADKTKARASIEEYSRQIVQHDAVLTGMEVMLELNINTEALKTVMKVKENLKHTATATVTSPAEGRKTVVTTPYTTVVCVSSNSTISAAADTTQANLSSSVTPSTVVTSYQGTSAQTSSMTQGTSLTQVPISNKQHQQPQISVALISQTSSVFGTSMNPNTTGLYSNLTAAYPNTVPPPHLGQPAIPAQQTNIVYAPSSFSQAALTTGVNTEMALQSQIPSQMTQVQFSQQYPCPVLPMSQISSQSVMHPRGLRPVINPAGISMGSASHPSSNPMMATAGPMMTATHGNIAFRPPPWQPRNATNQLRFPNFQQQPPTLPVNPLQVQQTLQQPYISSYGLPVGQSTAPLSQITQTPPVQNIGQIIEQQAEKALTKQILATGTFPAPGTKVELDIGDTEGNKTLKGRGEDKNVDGSELKNDKKFDKNSSIRNQSKYQSDKGEKRPYSKNDTDTNKRTKMDTKSQVSKEPSNYDAKEGRFKSSNKMESHVSNVGWNKGVNSRGRGFRNETRGAHFRNETRGGNSNRFGNRGNFRGQSRESNRGQYDNTYNRNSYRDRNDEERAYNSVDDRRASSSYQSEKPAYNNDFVHKDLIDDRNEPERVVRRVSPNGSPVMFDFHRDPEENSYRDEDNEHYYSTRVDREGSHREFVSSPTEFDLPLSPDQLENLLQRYNDREESDDEFKTDFRGSRSQERDIDEFEDSLRDRYYDDHNERFMDVDIDRHRNETNWRDRDAFDEKEITDGFDNVSEESLTSCHRDDRYIDRADSRQTKRYRDDRMHDDVYGDMIRDDHNDFERCGREAMGAYSGRETDRYRRGRADEIDTQDNDYRRRGSDIGQKVGEEMYGRRTPNDFDTERYRNKEDSRSRSYIDDSRGDKLRYDERDVEFRDQYRDTRSRDDRGHSEGRERSFRGDDFDRISKIDRDVQFQSDGRRDEDEELPDPSREEIEMLMRRADSTMRRNPEEDRQSAGRDVSRNTRGAPSGSGFQRGGGGRGRGFRGSRGSRGGGGFFRGRGNQSRDR